jgi:hypothetical protein
MRRGKLTLVAVNAARRWVALRAGEGARKEAERKKERKRVVCQLSLGAVVFLKALLESAATIYCDRGRQPAPCGSHDIAGANPSFA